VCFLSKKIKFLTKISIMKKAAIILLISALSTVAMAQNIFFTKNASIRFSSATAIENISAENKQVVSFVDFKKNKLNFAVLIKSFRFKNALMEEHFNENYLESDKFPKAKFKGTFSDISKLNLKKDGTYQLNVQGTLNMHGVKKNITVPVTITVKSGKLTASSKFSISPEDYGIKIPDVVKDKISKSLEINVLADYKPFKRK